MKILVYITFFLISNLLFSQEIKKVLQGNFKYALSVDNEVYGTYGGDEIFVYDKLTDTFEIYRDGEDGLVSEYCYEMTKFQNSIWFNCYYNVVAFNGESFFMFDRSFFGLEDEKWPENNHFEYVGASPELGLVVVTEDTTVFYKNGEFTKVANPVKFNRRYYDDLSELVYFDVFGDYFAVATSSDDIYVYSEENGFEKIDAFPTQHEQGIPKPVLYEDGNLALLNYKEQVLNIYERSGNKNQLKLPAIRGHEDLHFGYAQLFRNSTGNLMLPYYFNPQEDNNTCDGFAEMVIGSIQDRLPISFSLDLHLQHHGHPNKIFSNDYDGGVVLIDNLGDLVLIEHSVLSTNELEFDSKPEPKLRVFPNPSKDKLMFNDSRQFHYKIVDISGIVLKKGFHDFEESIDIIGLQSGVYFLVTDQGDKLRFFKQ